MVGRLVAVWDEMVILYDPGVDILLDLSVQEPRVPIDLRVPLHRSRTANSEKVANVIPVTAVMLQELVGAGVEVGLEPVGVKERVAFTAAAAAARVDMPNWGRSEQHLCAWVVRHVVNFVQCEVVRHGVEAHTNDNIR